LNDRSRWDKVYGSGRVEELPWFSTSLDEDICAALSKLGPPFGSLLSLGEGPGTQAILMAKLGWKVTATDVSEVAVRKARTRAAREGVDVKFIVDNVVSTGLTGSFRVVVDRGCFHTLEPLDREAYVKNVSLLLEQGGSLLLKTFSGEERMPGPYRFSPEEIRGIFVPPFTLVETKATFFRGTAGGDRKALFCAMRK